MNRQSTTSSRALLAVMFSFIALAALQAQPADDPVALRDRLVARYDVVALQQGVALVPKQPHATVRMIEIRNGAVAINGDEVTGRQLRDRVGADADLILRASYLSAEQQRVLATGAAASPAASVPSLSPPASVPPAAPRDDQRPRDSRAGDRVRVMGDVSVGRDERVQGDVVAVMGSAHVDGEVDGDLTVVMGSANLGPQAHVTGDVTVVAGRLNRADGARIDGSIHNADQEGRGREAASRVPGLIRNTLLGRVGSLAGTIVRVALVALLAMAVMAFGRASVVRVAERAATDPLRAGLIGFAAQVLFVPVLVLTVAVLAISVVGIPLLALVPFAVLLAVIGLVLGFTGVAYQIGRLVRDRMGWKARGDYATVLLGVVSITGLLLLARAAALVAGQTLGFPLFAVGFLVEYAAWTLGLGAAILIIPRRRRTPTVPPPIPA